MYALFRAHEQRTGAGPNPHVVTPIFQAVLDVIGQDSPNLGGLDDVIVGDTETTRLKSASTWFCTVLALLKFCCHRTNGLQGRKVASPETLALGQTSLSLLQASDQVAGAGRLRVVSSGEVRNYKSVKQTTLSLTKLPPRGHWMPLKQ
ncbi:hypothetical protein HPB47_000319 [Ixodes persulcatus]|uniref:Uncharacterized protein n=1 Tax=Ixodes persulcatus TaxID=34615 RepID=A0AC60PTR1_IXOPE|nr:hypothetical protein HPB47_000319 [Ixodes persulcatus]